MNIKKSLNEFINGRRPQERDASFDYCYNYFYGFYQRKRLPELANEENLQMSCLQLGFYLASWVMLRGSSFLLEKSVRNFADLIRTISKMNPVLWEIDLENYNDQNIALLLDCKRQIIIALGKENQPSDTLVSKIMLGVFANIPAFDQYFRKSLKVHSFNKKALLKIRTFYDQNKNIFDSFHVYTFDFSTSKETDIFYTKAKLIDMYGFS